MTSRRTALLASAGFAAVATALALPPRGASGRAAPPEEERSEFQLQVGKITYDVTPGKPVTIETPDGKRVEVVLKRNATLRYAGHGVAFDYPREMTVEVDDEDELASINVDGPGSILAVVQVMAAGGNPDPYRDLLRDQLKKEFSDRGGKAMEGDGKAVRRKIGGVERLGTTVRFTLAGEPLKAEIYAFPKGKNVVTLLLQAADDDAEQARTYFATLAESLR